MRHLELFKRREREKVRRRVGAEGIWSQCVLSLMLSEGESESLQSSDSQSGSIWAVLQALIY